MSWLFHLLVTVPVVFSIVLVAWVGYTCKVLDDALDPSNNDAESE